jgi:hypothetical protein
MSEIQERMEDIRKAGPSWKTDVVLIHHCYETWRSWSAEARDVWGHMHTPVHWGKSPEQVLAGVETFVHAMVNCEDGGAPYVDDDGYSHRCDPDVYMEPRP